MLSLIKKRQKKRAIQNIRNHFLAFGYDLRDLKDEDLEKGIIDFQEQLKNAGVSAKVASDCLKRVAQIIPTYNKAFHTDR